MKYEKSCSVQFCLSSRWASLCINLYFFFPHVLMISFSFFKGFLNDSVTKCIVALRLTVIVKVSTCMPVGSHSDKFQCSGKGKCITKPDEVRWTYQDLCIIWKFSAHKKCKGNCSWSFEYVLPCCCAIGFKNHRRY